MRDCIGCFRRGRIERDEEPAVPEDRVVVDIGNSLPGNADFATGNLTSRQVRTVNADHVIALGTDDVSFIVHGGKRDRNGTRKMRHKIKCRGATGSWQANDLNRLTTGAHLEPGQKEPRWRRPGNVHDRAVEAGPFLEVDPASHDGRVSLQLGGRGRLERDFERRPGDFHRHIDLGSPIGNEERIGKRGVVAGEGSQRDRRGHG